MVTTTLYRSSTLSSTRSSTRVVVRKSPVNKRLPQYKVLLINDDQNMKKYVMTVLKKVIPDMTHQESYDKTMEAHTLGRSILRHCDQPIAEDYCQGLRDNGLISLMEPSD